MQEGKGIVINPSEGEGVESTTEGVGIVSGSFEGEGIIKLPEEGIGIGD